ncbi:hypothetical protein GCM10007923_63680 [Shinella yambaruensis]|uniref:Uncharacterized protein n=1 Tax=Shinella yambaruensis TaxID=415996 RepID=A0ABQ5ZWR3_9HYPH|nr:hypothetical protein GCM10007923_63680 [Shinella yambaruensis]
MTDEGAVNGGAKVRYGLPQHRISPENSPNNSPTTRAHAGVDRKRIRASFLRWISSWPRWTDRDDLAARNIWFDELADADRADCIALTPAYLRMTPRPPAPRVYLKRRLWRTVPASARRAAAVLEPAPYGGKLWMASLFWLLLEPPVEHIHVTAFELEWVRSGRETEEELLCRKRVDFGWPRATTMINAACLQHLDAGLLPATDGWRGAEWGGALAQAWERMHARRCWPWLRVAPPQGYIWLPALPDGCADDDRVEAAHAAFSERAFELMNGDTGAEEN